MQSLKQILGWEEGRSRFLNICFSALIVLVLFTVAVGLHLEFTAPVVLDGLSFVLFAGRAPIGIEAGDNFKLP